MNICNQQLSKSLKKSPTEHSSKLIVIYNPKPLTPELIIQILPNIQEENASDVVRIDCSTFVLGN